MTIKKLRTRKIYHTASNSYFIYRGTRYHLSEFMRTDTEGYHGVMGMTNTSSMLVKLSNCGEAVTPALHY